MNRVSMEALSPPLEVSAISCAPRWGKGLGGETRERLGYRSLPQLCLVRGRSEGALPAPPRDTDIGPFFLPRPPHPPQARLVPRNPEDGPGSAASHDRRTVPQGRGRQAPGVGELGSVSRVGARTWPSISPSVGNVTRTLTHHICAPTTVFQPATRSFALTLNAPLKQPVSHGKGGVRVCTSGNTCLAHLRPVGLSEERG